MSTQPAQPQDATERKLRADLRAAVDGLKVARRRVEEAEEALDTFLDSRGLPPEREGR